MGALVAGVLLSVIGGMLAVNLWGAADKAARLNSRVGYYYANRSALWRFTGALWLAVGLPLAVWAAAFWIR